MRLQQQQRSFLPSFLLAFRLRHRILNPPRTSFSFLLFPPSFVTAYAMKASRGLALAQRGFFPLLPTDGLCFLPLDLGRDLEAQGPFHAILHKVLLRVLVVS